MITHDADRLRFEQEEDGRLVYASYRFRNGAYALTHVEADEELRGTGAASRFMQALVQHARDNSLKLAPLCSYARSWSKRHPEANDVLS